MNAEILESFQKLGGNIDLVQGNTLEEDLQAITFTQALYPHELWGTELYGVDEYYVAHKELYNTNKGAFYENLLSHFLSTEELPYGQMFYRGILFTPFRKGTADYEEWNDLFIDEDEVDLSQVYTVSHSKQPDFIQLLFSNGYPDHYYICLSDSNPDDPTVFGTDHEQFFSELTNEGPLSEFLKQFYTEKEFLDIVTTYIENK